MCVNTAKRLLYGLYTKATLWRAEWNVQHILEILATLPPGTYLPSMVQVSAPLNEVLNGDFMECS